MTDADERRPPLSTFGDIMEVIGRVERHHPVDRWRVGSVDVWPVARIRLGFGLFAAMQQDEVRSSSSLVRRVLDRLGRAIPTSPVRGVRPSSEGACAVFLSDGVSFLDTPDGPFDRHCDPIRIALRSKGIESVLLVPRALRTSAVPPHREVQLGIELAVARSRFRRPGTVDLPGFEQVSAELGEQLRGALPARSALVRRVCDIEGMARRFGQIFDRNGASLALVSEYYSPAGMAFVLAARRRGIPAVDIQHGVQGPLHWAYARWQRLPSRGSMLLPDRFWVWSSAEAECVGEWAPEGTDRAIVGGNAFLHMSVSESLPGSPEATRAVESLLERHGARQLVLVALGGVPEPQPFVDTVLDAAAGSVEDRLWAVRCHPTAPDRQRWLDGLRDRGLTNVEVDDSTTLPLFSLLGKAVAVVTRFSSVTIDAAAVGIPTIIVDPRGAELFADQVTGGDAYCIELEASRLAAVVASLEPRDGPPARIEGLRAGISELTEMALG